MTARRHRVLTGRHVAYAFVGFFLLVFAVNGVFLYFALESHPGLTEDDAYLRGIDYNRQIEAADRQRALGWKTVVGLDGEAVTIRIARADGEPLHGAQVLLAARRPATDGEDRRVALRELGPGLYGAPDATLPAGRWIVRFDIADGDRRARIEDELFVKEARGG